MLGMNTYPRAYIDACRARATQQIAHFRSAKAAAGSAGAEAFKALEPGFCNAMVQVLENDFVHRVRALELKDGNPCNEVRMLVNSILLHDGKMTELNPIKYKPANAVLGLKPGEVIALNIDDLDRLATAYFDDITRKFAA